MTVTSGFGGCESPAERKKQATEALEQKYHEKFDIVSYEAPKLLEDYYTVTAYSLEYPDLLFKATLDENNDSVMDSYVTKRLCNRMSEIISKNLGTLEMDYYVFTDALLEDTVLTDPEISVSEYMEENPGNKFMVYLFIEPQKGSVSNIMESLLHMMDGITTVSGTVFFYLADANLLEDIQEYVSSQDDLYTDFDRMTEDAYIGSVKFEKGYFSLSETALKKMVGDQL